MSTFTKNIDIDRGMYYPGPGRPINTADPVLVTMEGSERLFEDLDYGARGNPRRSQVQVRCRLVRNTHTANVLPKQTVGISKTDPGKALAQTAGDVSFAAAVDEFLPAAGVPPGGLYWVVISGPAKCIAAGAITAGVDVGTAATGKVDDAAATGLFGVALAAAAANNDPVMIHVRPSYR